MSKTKPSDAARKKTISVAGYRASRKRVINPEESPRLRRWDMLMVVALLLVCFLSPFEVGFLMEDKDMSFLKSGADWLFWLNRAMDVVFIGDMVLQFFIMYPVAGRFGVVWVSERRLIRRHYLTSWFAVDIVSILPFDILGLLVSSDDVSKLRLFRSVRMLRLLKLVRLVRGMRILKRWETELSFSYRKMTLGSLFVTVIVAAHWMSCVLGMISNVQGDPCLEEGLDEPPGCARTWFSEFAADLSAQEQQVTPWSSYIAALHVTATIIVHPYAAQPTSTAEQACFTALLFMGGFIWTRVISRSTAVQTSLDRHGIFFRQTMDDLNANATDLALSRELRKRLRAFFMNTRDVSQRNTWQEICTRMSPSLQTEVAVEQHSSWLIAVPFLGGSSRYFIAELAKNIGTERYAQQETFGQNFRLYVMNRGIASRIVGLRCQLRVMVPGLPWGLEHLVFNTAFLLEPNTATAITFSEVLELSREDFDQVRTEFPENEPRIRRFYVKMAVIRGVIKLARELKPQCQYSSQSDGLISHTTSMVSEDLGDSPLDQHRSHAMRMERDMRRRMRKYSKSSVVLGEAVAPAVPAPQDNGNEDLKGLEERLTQRFEEGLKKAVANLKKELSADIRRCLLKGMLTCRSPPPLEPGI